MTSCIYVTITSLFAILMAKNSYKVTYYYMLDGLVRLHEPNNHHHVYCIILTWYICNTLLTIRQNSKKTFCLHGITGVLVSKEI